MGVAESKELAECLLVACQLAENEGKTELDPKQILENKTINCTLKHICKYIPRDIRGSAHDSALKRATTRPLAKIEVPQVVQDLQERHRTLFPEPEYGSKSGDQIQCFPEIIPGNSLADCYKATVLHEEQQHLCNVRLRLLYIVFFRLKQEINPGSQYQYYSAANFIAKTICDANDSNQPIDIIEKRIRAWVGNGERYESLAHDLGGLGALYILPDLGGESFWKRKLPKSADNQGRISIIQKLKQQDIPAEASRRGLHTIANDQVKSILDPLLKSVKEILNRELSQAHSISTAQNEPNQHSGNANRRDRVSTAPTHTLDVNQSLNSQPLRDLPDSQQSFDRTLSQDISTLPPPNVHFDQASSVPLMSVYGYLEQPGLHSTMQNNYTEQGDMLQVETYQFPGQSSFYLSQQSTLAPETASPQLDIYGYLEQPNPYGVQPSTVTAHTNTPDLNLFGFLEQTISYEKQQSNSRRQMIPTPPNDYKDHPSPFIYDEMSVTA